MKLLTSFLKWFILLVIKLYQKHVLFLQNTVQGLEIPLYQMYTQFSYNIHNV